ncbi:MAG: hypothetical protein ABIS67_15465, partial [Candidatus Eisenbacteria bacterium]
MRRISLVFALVLLACGLAVAPRFLISRTSGTNDFVHFESPHVHPAELTPTRDRLLVVNTPDNRITVFDVSDSLPEKQQEIFVGLEPVSVRALDDSTAWVVNFLSDDVSIVNLNTLNVKATLRVGDEPGDVVFAGTPIRAYVSVGGEDAVKIYDPANLSAAPTVISLPGSEPRALAKTSDGAKVYVSLFQSGNHTTLLSPEKLPTDSVPPDYDLPMDPGLPAAPHVGLVVQSQTGGNWYDMYGNLWNHHIKYQVIEKDVIEINTSTQAIARSFGGWASNVMGLAVSPTDSRVFYVGTEARNLLRFEPRMLGYTVETNAVFVNQGTGLSAPRKLNPHIDFDISPGTQAEADSALGIPSGVAFADAGNRAYVSAFANNRIGVLNPAGGAFSTVLARVPCVAGPTGIVVDDANNRLFIVGRYRNELQTMTSDIFRSMEKQRIGFDPTPDVIVNGRKFMYGGFTSSHGDQACASCHVFGDTDGLSWDLGDPNGAFVPPGGSPPGLLGFHPMKGPLITQTLRGMGGTGPLHWRGDRNNFAAFNNAFLTLLGRAAPLADSQMTAFADFVLPMAYPPNPRQHLDRTFPDAPLGEGSALRGQNFFVSTAVDSGMVCADCHTTASFGSGTNGAMIRAAHIDQAQDLKVPQLRNLYKKTNFLDQPAAQNKRGFGYSHNGSVDLTSNFDHGPGFSYGPDSAASADNRRDLGAFLNAFDTGLAPAVGYQLTFDGTNNSDPTTLARLDTLSAQVTATNCDLVAHGRVDGAARSWQYLGGGLWKPSKASLGNVTTANLIALAGLGTEVTVTGVPPGSGVRMGLDRDRDTYLDSDETEAGSDPGNPLSTPLNVSVGPGTTMPTRLATIGP